MLRFDPSRRQRVLPVLGGVLLLAANLAPGGGAPAGDPSSARIMTAIERAQRSGDRIFSMDIQLTVPGRYQSERRMLGVSHHDGRVTRILYVITSPRLLRGAALMISDPLDPRQPDQIWFALPGLKTAQEIQAGSLRLLVPGTGLTYEESRGWVPTDKYRFIMTTSAKDETTIEARPNTDSLVKMLGTSRLLIRVDTEKNVVRGVTFFDEAGTRAKSYEAREHVRVGRRWYPGCVEILQESQQSAVSISYHYAALERAPPTDLFRADPASAFLDRLLAWRDRSGLSAAFPDSLPAP